MASIQTTTQRDKRQDFHSDTVALPALTARHRVPLRQIEATRLTKTNTSDVDAEALAAELRRHVRGEVRFDDGSRALYATDGSNYRQVPIGVVLPRSDEDVVETMAACRRTALRRPGGLGRRWSGRRARLWPAGGPRRPARSRPGPVGRFPPPPPR